MSDMWLWLMVFLLGGYHGLNPAMGWLFAVALGLQEKSGKAVLRSLLPLGLGHLASVLIIIGFAQAAQFALPMSSVRILAAGSLVSFGLYRLLRARHPRWVGLSVSSGELTLWSFLMASAHGAGLMLLPFVLTVPAQPLANNHAHLAMLAGGSPAAAATLMHWYFPVGLHTLGYLLASASLALVVYYKVGIAVLRRAWFNLDLVWVGALLTMGILTLTW